MSPGNPRYVVCPRCQLPNPVGPSTCWKCGSPLPEVAVLPSAFSRPPSAAPGGWLPAPAMGNRTAPPVEAPSGVVAPDYSMRYDGPSVTTTPSVAERPPRRLRRGPLIGGIVLLAIGVLLLVAAFAIGGSTVTQTVPAGSGLTLAPTALSSVTATISWSGGNSTSMVYLITGSPSCSSPSGIVGQGSGSNGSFSVTLSSNTQYLLYACSGSTAQGMVFSYTVTSGFSTLDLISIVLIVLGAILILLAFRRRKEDWE
ncbi:MAG: zinc ribbon domain-containing protein [Thermoplasmata archaeon]